MTRAHVFRLDDLVTEFIGPLERFISVTHPKANRRHGRSVTARYAPGKARLGIQHQVDVARRPALGVQRVVSTDAGHAQGAQQLAQRRQVLGLDGYFEKGDGLDGLRCGNAAIPLHTAQ